MTAKKVSIPTGPGEKISGRLSLPKNQDRGQGIVFAHGAANDMDHPLLAAVAEGLACQGFSCLRFNFPYREKGRKSPDPEHRLIHAWISAVDHVKKQTGCQNVVAAGKSLGARMAAQAYAQGDLQVQGLIFLGFPLHAPGKKESLRDGLLKKINIPVLFFQGTRDPFCDLDLLKPVLKSMAAPPPLEIIQGGDHSLNLPKSDPRPQADIHGRVIKTCQEWLKDNLG